MSYISGPLGAFNNFQFIDPGTLATRQNLAPGPMCKPLLKNRSLPQSPLPGTQASITIDLLTAAEPSSSNAYYQSILPSLNDYALAYLVNTPLRLAHFLSQIAHESHFKTKEENGNYSAKRMRQVFGCKGGQKQYDPITDDCKNGRLREKLWTEESKYALNSKNLLNYAYASRMGNGNEASGDGYNYRGRGMIQLTGKDMYAKFTASHNKKNPSDQQDFVAMPDLVSELKYGIESAFFFWDSKGLNKMADVDDLEKATIRVNGGTNGLADRKSRLLRLKRKLKII